jgi:hypothetical protein
MKPVCAFALLVLLIEQALHAQPGKTVTVKAGDDIAKAWSPAGFYRFPQFGKATLFRKTGLGQSNSLFNYNILSGKIQFINETGDTLDLINPSLFDSFMFEKTIFYYDDGFLELVSSTNLIRLVKKTKIKMRPETIGAYGAANSTAATDRISSYSISGNMYSFTLNENMIVKENVSLFFMDAEGRLMKATKSNLLLLLPLDQQEKLTVYLTKNKVSFEKERDLKHMLENL